MFDAIFKGEKFRMTCTLDFGKIFVLLHIATNPLSMKKNHYICKYSFRSGLVTMTYKSTAQDHMYRLRFQKFRGYIWRNF